MTARLRAWVNHLAQYEASQILSSTVDADGRVVALLTGSRAVVVDGRDTTEVDLEDSAFGSPWIDTLGDGFVIVEARSRSRTEHSGRIVGPDGATRTTFNAGYGIGNLLTDRSGAIWIDYRDDGWIIAPPMGLITEPFDVPAPGLIRWTETGELEWIAVFDPRADFVWVDTYALNVGDSRVWAYPYMTFPLVEIGREGIRSVRSTRVRISPRGLAVAGSRVAFLGSQNVSYADVTEDSVEIVSTEPLVMPDGSRPASWPSRQVCRDDRIWMQFGDPREWFVLEI
jgi:hypothetical protein